MKKFDDDLEFESLNDEPRDTRFILPIIVVAVLLVIVIVALVLLGKNKDTSADLMSTEQSETTETETQTTEVMGNIATTESTEEVEADDPQNGNMGTDTGASVDVTALLSAGNVTESGETTFGIDVARYQGTIDWSQVAASGVQFAMIRVGYRTQKTGEIVADTNAKYNMQEAQANGIKIGAYFFSTAVTTDEAVQEADWVADYISQYQITYPVAFNCEGFENADSRQYAMTQSERTDMAIAFLTEAIRQCFMRQKMRCLAMQNGILQELKKLIKSGCLNIHLYRIHRPHSPITLEHMQCGSTPIRER